MKVLAALLALGMLVPLLLAACKVMEVPAAFDLSSALAGLVGSVWIAAGAVLSRREAKRIGNLRPKSAIHAMLAAMQLASRHIAFGVPYLVLGAFIFASKVVGHLLGFW